MAKIYETEDGKLFDREWEGQDHANKLAQDKAEWEAEQSRLSSLDNQRRFASGDYMLDGNDLLDRGDYDGAIAAYNKGLLHHDYAGLYDMRGEAYRRKGDYDKAFADYNHAIHMGALGTRYKEEITYYHRASAYYDMGDYENCIADLTYALGGYYGGFAYTLKPAVDGICETFGIMYNRIGDECAKRSREDLAVYYYKKGADFGSKDAAAKLAKKGISYAPKTPKESLKVKKDEEKEFWPRETLSAAYTAIFTEASPGIAVNDWAMNLAKTATHYSYSDSPRDLKRASMLCNKVLYMRMNNKAAIYTAHEALGRVLNYPDGKNDSIEAYKRAADWGSEDAVKVLYDKFSIEYTPGKPKDYDYYFSPDNAGLLRTFGSTGTSVNVNRNFARSLIPSIILGFGLMFAINWGFKQFTGEGSGLLNSLLALGVGAAFFVKLISGKAWKLVIPLAVLSLAGYLCQFGVIPERLFDRGDTAAAQTESAAVQTNTATVISDALNLRAEASGGAAVVKTLKKGDTLTVTGEDADGWTPVEHEGDTGWVSSEFLERN